MGTNIIVLDSPEAVHGLMERRSYIYSDRARMPMTNELMHWSFNIGFMPYGNFWRKSRRVFHQFFNSTAVQRFHPNELKATRHLLERLLDDPSDVFENLRYLSGETIMSVAYGLEIKQKGDPHIEMAEQGVHPLAVAAVPGKFLVDVIPILKYVPEWMPGAGFRKKAKEWRKLAMTMVNMPFEAAKHLIAEGKAKPSFTSQSIQRASETNDDAYHENVIRCCAGTMFAAASDTTTVAISFCILTLLENPEILKKAQDQLDSVVKPGYLPDFDDEENLPYITALTLETLRWRVVTPIAIPRYLQVDNEYKGYRIPRGSIIIPNAWAMLHNEEVYLDPFAFKP